MIDAEPEHVSVVRGRALAWMQMATVLVSGVSAWCLAPDLKTTEDHAEFSEFFATSAQVIAAVLIALALEGRLVVRSMFLAVVAAASIAVGEVSALAALSPRLPDELYRCLFALTVGSGLGGLATALVVGAQALSDRRDALRDFELGRLAERRDRDAGGR